MYIAYLDALMLVELESLKLMTLMLVEVAENFMNATLNLVRNFEPANPQLVGNGLLQLWPKMNMI